MFYSKQLKKFKDIKHCFFSRNNGFSKGLYSSLNCGKGSNDKTQNITKNLKKICVVMKIKFNNLILMNQTHSNKVIFTNKFINRLNSIMTSTTSTKFCFYLSKIYIEIVVKNNYVFCFNFKIVN